MTKHIKTYIKKPEAWLWIVALAYIALQIFTLGRRAFDGDEGVILNVVEANRWAEFWARISNDVHPPLYHILTKISVSVFGINEWSLRLVAALAGLALIFAGFWIGKKIFQNKWQALALSILTALSPYLFFFHQEARFYSVLLLGAILTYGALLELSKKPTNIKNWIIYTLGALILVWSQHLGWFILASEFLAIIISKKYKLIGRWFMAFAVVVLTYVPFIPIAVSQFSGRLGEQGGLKLADNLAGIIGAFYRFGAGRLVLGIDPLALIQGGWLKIALFIISLGTIVILVSYGIDKKQRANFWRRQAWTIVICGVIAALLVSEIGGRAVRYFIYLWPFFGALVVAGIWRLWPRPLGKAVVGLFLIVSILSLGKHIQISAGAASARTVADYINQNATENNVVLSKGALASGEKAVIKYYLDLNVKVIDYYENYSPGALASEQETSEEIINNLINKYPIVWYYDFTYEKLEESSINKDAKIKKYQIGRDKEEQEIIIYKISKLK